MEIYKDLNSDASKEFEKLLNSQLSKNKIEEGSIVQAEITKISDKFCYCYIGGMKSEAMIDLSEFKSIDQQDKIKVGSKIEVLLENIESKSGEIIVSIEKAHKQKGFDILKKAYENKEHRTGMIVGKVKGGVLFKDKETGILTFMPGSQISQRPMKDINSLMNKEFKAAIIKLDLVRGNLCTSRRAVISAEKEEDKKTIIERYKVGDKISGVCKSLSSFGAFFDVNNGELDVLTHIQEIAYSRINHPDEVLEVGKNYDLKVISVDLNKLQVGTSIKQLGPDPFEHISNYEVGKTYSVTIKKIVDYGCFCELEPGLSTLLHSSECSWKKKNVSPKNMFQVNQKISCVITDIDIEKRRIAISHKLTQENPYTALEKKFNVGSEIDAVVTNQNEYALYARLGEFSIDGFLHANDCSWVSTKPEEELKKFKKGDKIKVKILEIKPEEQRVRIGLKQMQPDPFEWFKEKKVNDIITVKVVYSDSKGMTVKPEGCDLEFLIKKSQIAINAADQRVNRWIKGDRTDAAISEISLEKRKVSLSIKLLEELQNKEAVSKFSSPLSGRNLPFSSLSKKLDDKKKKTE